MQVQANDAGIWRVNFCESGFGMGEVVLYDLRRRGELEALGKGGGM